MYRPGGRSPIRPGRLPGVPECRSAPRCALEPIDEALKRPDSAPPAIRRRPSVLRRRRSGRKTWRRHGRPLAVESAAARLRRNRRRIGVVWRSVAVARRADASLSTREASVESAAVPDGDGRAAAGLMILTSGLRAVGIDFDNAQVLSSDSASAVVFRTSC